MSVLLLLPWSQGVFLHISWALAKAIVPDSIFISAMGYYPLYIQPLTLCFFHSTSGLRGTRAHENTTFL